MSHFYHFCKVVSTTNVLVVAMYFSSQLPIITLTYHQASYDKEPMQRQEFPNDIYE